MRIWTSLDAWPPVQPPKCNSLEVESEESQDIGWMVEKHAEEKWEQEEEEEEKERGGRGRWRGRGRGRRRWCERTTERRRFMFGGCHM